MLLTIAAPISIGDLGYLLHKHPEKHHTFELPFGKAHVFYPRGETGHAKAALLLDIDPVSLVRGRPDSKGEGALDQYVNDRAYASSSFLSVAISRVFGSALGGRSKERPELAERAMDLAATVATVPCRGGESFLRGLFEPLGYAVQAEHHPLDPQFPEWGEGPYFTIQLSGHVRLRDLLTHIYVLIPVLDAEKHYWVGGDEVEKLLAKGEGWLAAHPLKEAITARYLRYDRRLTREALARLADEESPDPDAEQQDRSREEEQIETPMRLWEHRLSAVAGALATLEAKRVIDLGCGEGRLLGALLKDRKFEQIVGMDVSWRSLETAQRRLRFDQLAPAVRQRIDLIHGSLMYRDKRLEGFDAAAVIEVIEHLDAARLTAFERVVFEHARPGAVVITTPNAEYNALFPTLPAGQFRHKDHRFEWTRGQFAAWANRVGGQYGYAVRFAPIGPEDASLGSPTQMGIFTR